jgi:predicted O-methyltransferase YrrM
VLPPARHTEPSAVLSADDDPGRPTDELIALALRAAGRARGLSLAAVSARLPGPPYYPDVWPGEHYRLLAALVAELAPRAVVEVGTAAGLSALALLHALPADGTLTTFDVVPWAAVPAPALRPADFADGRLRQVVGDLADPRVLAEHTPTLRAADLIFVDGPKDGAFEPALLAAFDRVGLPRRPLVVLDDTRLLPMLGVWRRIARPKLDLTSFGHWSGTGLVRWG